MKNTFEYIIEILTICQGVWVVTLMGFLMYHYIVKSIKNRILENNALAMGVSYSLLTVATMMTSIRGVFHWYEPWQVLVIIGYIFGDYTIVRMLKHTTRNDKTTKIVRDYIKNSEKELKLKKDEKI